MLEIKDFKVKEAEFRLSYEHSEKGLTITIERLYNGMRYEGVRFNTNGEKMKVEAKTGEFYLDT